MKVIYDKLPSKRPRCIATIGTFDGIHLGHQFILKKVVSQASQAKVNSLVITFDILPQQFLRRRKVVNSWGPRKKFCGCLTDLEQKKALIQAQGLDYLWLLKANRRFLELPGRSFIAYICRYFNIEKLILGSDFHFGFAGRGDIKYLKELSCDYDFKVQVINKKKENKKIISSSHIRDLIKRGEISQANQLLGRLFSLGGKVSRGKALGAKLGFPTANLILSDYIMPAAGVYAGLVQYKTKLYLAAIDVQIKSTSNSYESALIEAYIINFKKNILGEELTVFFLEKIRNRHKFSSQKLLSQAILKDTNFLTSKYSTYQSKSTQPLVP